MKNQVLIIFLILYNGLLSQSETKFSGKACFFNDRVLVRWIPHSPEAWEKSCKYGFTLKVVDAENKVVRDFPIIPALEFPNEAWDSLSRKNPSALMLFNSMKQIRKGEKITSGKENAHNIFFLSLAALDADTALAAMVGCFYSFSLSPPLNEVEITLELCWNFSGEKGAIKIIPERATPALISPELKANGNAIAISWPARQYTRTYHGYFILRRDGETTKQLNKSPLVYLVNTYSDSLIHYLDTTAEAGKTYFYKIIPMDYFNIKDSSGLERRIDFFPPGAFQVILDSVSWKSDSLVFRYKKKGNHENLKASEISIRNKEGKVLFSHKKSCFQEVVAWKPDREGLVFISQVLHFGSGISTPSEERVYEVPDIFPPARPRPPILSSPGKGLVQISPDFDNTDQISGIRIFRRMGLKGLYRDLYSGPLTKGFYVDTLPMNTLENVVWYKYQLFDAAFNHSSFSDSAVFFLEDTIPPIRPVVYHAGNENGEIKICFWFFPEENLKIGLWDKNVALDCRLFTRRDSGCFLCPEGLPQTEFNFVIRVTDPSGNISNSHPFRFKKPDAVIQPGFVISHRIQHVPGFITISLDKFSPHVQWQVFKKKADEPFQLIKTIPAGTTSFVDRAVYINNTYTYFVSGFGVEGDPIPPSVPVIVIY